MKVQIQHFNITKMKWKSLNYLYIYTPFSEKTVKIDMFLENIFIGQNCIFWWKTFLSNYFLASSSNQISLNERDIPKPWYRSEFWRHSKKNSVPSATYYPVKNLFVLHVAMKVVFVCHPYPLPKLSRTTILPPTGIQEVTQTHDKCRHQLRFSL